MQRLGKGEAERGWGEVAGSAAKGEKVEGTRERIAQRDGVVNIILL